jgi:hypothetical protein
VSIFVNEAQPPHLCVQYLSVRHYAAVTVRLPPDADATADAAADAAADGAAGTCDAPDHAPSSCAAAATAAAIDLLSRRAVGSLDVESSLRVGVRPTSSPVEPPVGFLHTTLVT